MGDNRVLSSHFRVEMTLKLPVTLNQVYELILIFVLLETTHQNVIQVFHLEDPLHVLIKEGLPFILR